MISILIQKFIRNSDDIKNPDVRKSYGVLGGVLGIICNTVLFFVKIVIGASINSIAVVSDAFNNLSDLGSSVVTVIGAKLGGKRADNEHPYGHGRAEYISALVISFLIIFFGAELLKSSAEKVFAVEEVAVSYVSAVVLMISLPIKLWMWKYNTFMGKKINSKMLLAAARDSLNDTIASVAVIASAIFSPYLAFPIDGVTGVCISLLIMKAGLDIAKETTESLLGTAPDEKLVSKIEEYLTKEEKIIGMHGLMVHDYGPGCKIASVHAEMPADLSLVEAHKVVDEIEHRILRELNVDIVIHTDPIITAKNDEI